MNKFRYIDDTKFRFRLIGEYKILCKKSIYHFKFMHLYRCQIDPNRNVDKYLASNLRFKKQNYSKGYSWDFHDEKHNWGWWINELIMEKYFTFIGEKPIL